MLLRLFLLASLIAPFLNGAAQAQQFADANWPNLLRTMVRFNALDLSDPTLIDEYAIVTECDLYKAFYQNDFKWNQVREAVRQSVKINIATFPTNYHYDVKMQLDRYDFATRLFRFTDKSTIHNANSFLLYAVSGTDCGSADIYNVPRSFHAVISPPLNIEGLPLEEKEAQALLKQMDLDQNANRIIFARFNLRITYIDAFRRVRAADDATTKAHYGQSKSDLENNVRFEAQIDSIDFYVDEQRTRLIYHYQM